MAEAVQMYRRLAGARLRSDLQYRGSFALFTLGQALISGLDFAAVAIIFGQVDELGGWTFGQVALLYGVGAVSFGLTDMFVSQVELLPDLVRTGVFDRMLTRPVHALVQVLAEDFALRRIGKLLQAVVVLAIAIPAAHVDWTPGRIVMLVVAIVAGTAIYAALWVLIGAAAFILLDSRELLNTLTYGGSFLTQYPLQIFGVWLRRILAFVVPLAFTAYYPCLYLLDKPDPLGGPRWLMFASPLVAVAFGAVAAGAWNTAVRRYRSTGS